MTFSILVRDTQTGMLGGAAATGSLCVGGWVLRGGADRGLSASQGTAPSTLWGEDVLALMHGGMRAAEAVERVTRADRGAAHRQLAALDPEGGVGHFTGAQSIAACGALADGDVVVSGNMLSHDGVLDAVLRGYRAGTGDLAKRLLAALRAGHSAGSDSRGLRSAALLVVSRAMPPLTLRIDCSATPLEDLASLHHASQTAPYRDWLDMVPVLEDPHRAP